MKEYTDAWAMNTTKYCRCCHTAEGGRIYICPACDEGLLWDHCRGTLSGKALTITNSGMHFSLFPAFYHKWFANISIQYIFRRGLHQKSRR
jgi:hypothetical protein